jgi:hypothetical protein
MAHAISLTDGTTTVNLYDLANTFITAEGWELATAGVGPQAEPEIADSMELLIQASSVANLQTAVRTIEGLLVSADRRQRTGLGARVFLQAQFDGEASAWRTEVLAGKLEVPQAPDQWSALKIEAVLGITRRNYWEGPRTQIALTNGNGTNNTAGLTIYNHDDGDATNDNYLQIAGASVTGMMPAPVEIELKNTSGGAVNYSNIYLANNVFADPANLAHMIEGESRDSGYGSIVANGASSGGNYNEVSFTTAAAGTMLFTLSAATLQRLAGRWFRLLARFHFLSGDAIVQARIMDSTGTRILWAGPEVQPNTGALYHLYDLGALPFPPGGYSTSWGSLKLSLRYSTGVAGTSTADLDFLQLTPTDSFRHLRMLTYPVPNNDLVVDDGIEGLAYVSLSAAPTPLVAPRGDPLMVYPGILQRVYVLCDEQNNAVNIARTWAVRMWYRPRRMTL